MMHGQANIKCPFISFSVAVSYYHSDSIIKQTVSKPYFKYTGFFICVQFCQPWNFPFCESQYTFERSLASSQSYQMIIYYLDKLMLVLRIQVFWLVTQQVPTFRRRIAFTFMDEATIFVACLVVDEESMVSVTFPKTWVNMNLLYGHK